MNILELTEKKIAEGKSILLELDSMRETAGIAMNVTYYMHEDVEKYRRRVGTWQLTSKEVLIRAVRRCRRIQGWS